MIQIDTFVKGFSGRIGQAHGEPWELMQGLNDLLTEMMQNLGDDFLIENQIAIHKTAVIEANVTLKAPVIIGANCFIGANAYLRNGVFLGNGVKIGTGCEIKSSVVFDKSSIAHFNFIGDSIIGSSVNFEAGSITANHFNERRDKDVYVVYQGNVINTGVHKFGALVGDGSKIGANAVLSPGTLLKRDTVVQRLELIDQLNQVRS
ncbi:DapH/DapD/GlmU-related protein [Lutimonas sp.]|uniref:DapH/DapD/GlmU-related protein n=1 Tax=Lutimonas sp. TaxID=1872403 RepID=UPI003D9AE1B0